MSETTVGVQSRYDAIDVGLFNTKQRVTLSTVREDEVKEGSVGVFGENTVRWTNWVRTIAGLRADAYWTDVASDRAANSGSDLDTIVSPKFGIVFGPWAKTELYLNAGTGFHSNDARGTVTTVDPVTLSPSRRRRSWCAPRVPRSASAPQPYKGDSTTFAVRARLRLRDRVRRRRRHDGGQPP